MTCTTMSPRSTSTHSPDSSPSMPITSPPASLTLSWTLRAIDLTWRLETPVAITTRSNRGESLLVLSTSMSLPLMSSRAATAIFWSFLMSMRGPVDLMGFNIVENGVGNQIARAEAAHQSLADCGRGNLQRGDGEGDDAPGGCTGQVGGDSAACGEFAIKRRYLPAKRRPRYAKRASAVRVDAG